MWTLQVYDTDNNRWVAIFESLDDHVVLEEYEKMLRSEEAKTGLRVLDSRGNSSRLCHS